MLYIAHGDVSNPQHPILKWVLVTPGSVVVTPGSVVVTTGSVVVTTGSVVVYTGSNISYSGSVVVTSCSPLCPSPNQWNQNVNTGEVRSVRRSSRESNLPEKLNVFVLDDKNSKESPWQGFAAALAVLITEASQSRQ
ncbi:hypothetical protein Tco_1363275, partial [Tanacetum coccineum]